MSTTTSIRLSSELLHRVKEHASVMAERAGLPRVSQNAAIEQLLRHALQHLYADGRSRG